MKINLREYLKLTFIYTALAAFPPLLQIFIRPVIEGEGRLSASEFSQLSITELIISLAFTIIMYSMNNAIARFHFDYHKDEESHKRMVSSIFNLMIIRGLILIGIVLVITPFIGKFFTQPELQNFRSYGIAAVITGFNRAIVLTAAALYRNEKKVGLFILLMLGWGLIRTFLQLVFLFKFDMSFTGYVNGNCLGSIIVSAIILVYIFKQTGFKYDRKILKPIIQFSRPLFHYGIIYWGITFIDRLFLESNPLELGIYDTAVGFAFGIQMILQGMQGATQPEIYEMMSEGIQKNLEGIKQLSNIMIAQSELLIAFMILPTMIYLNFFFETELTQASQLVGIIYVKFLLRSQFIIFSFPVFYQKKTKAFLYINILVLAASLLANYIFIPMFNAYGAIIAGMIAFFLQAIITYFYQKRIVSIPWNLNKLLYYPFMIVGLTIILEIVKIQFNINQFVIASIVTLIIFASVMILYKNDIKKRIKIKT